VPSAAILVVDDDQAFRTAVVRLLARHGHPAFAVDTAELALRHIEERDFDLAILDINLRASDGIDLLTEIKTRAPTTEGIILSGHGSIENAMRSAHAGAFDFIEKPYREERLIHAVDRALERRRLRQTTALFHAVQVIFRTRDLERLPESIVKVSMEVMRADASTLLLPGLDGKFYVACAFGLDAEVARNARIAVGEGIAGQVALSRTPLVICGDASVHPDLHSVTPCVRVRSSIVYPLVLADQVIGILTFNRLTDDCPFRPTDLDRAAVLASQVLLALENARLVRQNVTAEKLAAVGQLAAGIAHEINTPIQFVGDSLEFLNDAFGTLVHAVDRLEDIVERISASPPPDGGRSLLLEARQVADEMDLSYLKGAVPKALERTAEGIGRVAKIVRAVKELGQPDRHEKIAADLNQCLQSTLIVCCGEYKYVADVETDFAELRTVVCHPGELNQVFLNLIVNAGHAIADVVSGSDRRGKIVVRTRPESDCAVVSIEDTGPGIPAEVQPRIFDPFFTTKPVGRGTGLGLAVARTIVEKHGGTLTFETELGRGTRFSVRLPFERT
jgi:signal transduction histidine kinase/FixJ family two-component response regulator